jgi:integrase
VHSELVERFLEDLARRAEAGEIDPRTVARYTSSLGHYLAFAGQPEIASSYPYITGVNRTFQLKLAGFLKQRTITSNGHPHTPRRPMKNSIFVEDTVRAMYQWAADPERGHLLPDGFRNPFLSAARPRRELAPDPVGVPDISMEMAGQFLEACDAYQLPLFATIVLFGLRAAEPAHLFQESLRDGWLQVPCIPELSILTKGRRNKTLPVLPLLNKLLLQERHQGLIFLRRNVLESREDAPLANASLSILIEEFRSRSTRNGCNGICSMEKLDLRNQILKEAGGLCYDQIEAEFQRVARKLGWPRIATLKDFRHLFSTSLENAGVPLYFRQYLMGQAPTNAPITTYTHLAPEKIRNHYDRAIQQEFQPVLGALQRRISAIPSSTLIGSRKTDALDGLDDGRDTSVAFI